MPEPNRRTAFSTLWAMDAMNPSQSPPTSRGQALPQSFQPRFCPSQPAQGCEDSLDNGPTPRHLSPIGGSLVAFLGLKVQRVIDG